MRKFLLIAIFLTIMAPGAVRGQNVTVRSAISRMLYDKKYFPELYGEGVTPTFPSLNVKLGWKDCSGSPYAYICNRPEYGIAIQVDGLADAKALNGPGMGNIYSLFGYFDRDIINAGRFSLGYSAGFGLGCSFSKLYDPITNPWNRLISIPVNSHITFGLQAEVALSDKYSAGIGFYFNHNSNGAVHFPNRGYNGFELALCFGMNDLKYNEPMPERIDDGFRRKFVFNVQASGGIMSNEEYFYYCLENVENYDGNNQYYPKYSVSADCLYKYCHTHATGIGVDLFVTPFCDHIAEYDGRGLEYDPVSVGISIRHEMRYRNASLTAGVGRYLYDNDGLARNKKLYQLVLIKYHFPSLADTYTGIVLKAHKFMAAESIQLCLGKSF